MLQQLIALSHEPPVVFVVLFFLSLVASYILFKLLDSRATIRRKGWSAGGAIAGFLLILFGSWYAVQPSFNTQRRILPVSTPAGFKVVSASDVGVAIAIPSDWERKDLPTTLMYEPKTLKPNSDDPRMMVIQIQACEDLRLLTSEEDLAQTKQGMKELFTFMSLRGPSVNDPYLGHKGSTTPVVITIPGHLLEPVRSNDYTLNLIVREIFDETNRRCIALLYPDNELGRRLGSTLNITSPSQ